MTINHSPLHGSDDGTYPLPAFHFSISFDGNSNDSSFCEIGGLTTELQFEEVFEGGVNSHSHKLPIKTKHSNIIVKRGIILKKSLLNRWCNSILEEGFNYPVETKNIIISLLNENSSPAKCWDIIRAYPVKWKIDNFNSTENKIAIESIEFAHSGIKQLL